jgi:multimeric flavodoxin WrbA
MGSKVVAIVGSYRKGGMTDAAVDAILQGAREKGAETETIYLTEQHLEFCTNCRKCVQASGAERGKCVIDDDLEPILSRIEAADVLVLSSPVNFYNVTAQFRKFLERLSGYFCWPWGQMSPKVRSKQRKRKAVLVASAGMPGFLIPWATGAGRALRIAAGLLGARPVAHLWIGLAAREPHPSLSRRTLARARRIGMSLA